MDPLTQGLLGGLVGHLGFESKLGRKATWLGVAAGMAPDLDVVVGGVGRLLGDEFIGLHTHRQFSHSLAFAPVGALLIAAILRRGAPWGWAFACALAAWLTHGPLDCCTTYGTEILWPFDRGRVSWNNVSIIDPAYTLLLAVGLYAGHRRQARRVAVAGFVLSLAYLGWGAVRSDAAATAAIAQIQANGWGGPRRVMAAATPLNNVLWRVIAQLEDGRWTAGLARVVPLSEVQVRLSEPFDDHRPAEADGWIAGSRELAIFERFAQGWTRWKPGPQGVGWRVVDMRYAGGLTAGAADGDNLWGVDVRPQPPGPDKPSVEVSRYHTKVRPDLRRFGRALFGGL